MAEERAEIRLDDLLSDPIVRLVMRRDGVDAGALRQLIRSRAQHAVKRAARRGEKTSRGADGVAGLRRVKRSGMRPPRPRA